MNAKRLLPLALLPLLAACLPPPPPPTQPVDTLTYNGILQEGGHPMYFDDPATSAPLVHVNVPAAYEGKTCTLTLHVRNGQQAWEATEVWVVTYPDVLSAPGAEATPGLVTDRSGRFVMHAYVQLGFTGEAFEADATATYGDCDA